MICIVGCPSMGILQNVIDIIVGVVIRPTAPPPARRLAMLFAWPLHRAALSGQCDSVSLREKTGSNMPESAEA